MATDFQRIAFRAAFRTAREAAGLTQRQVAAKLGCAPSTVAQWDGGVSAPREDMAARLEQLLDAEPGEFRQLLGFAFRDLTTPGSFAEAVESDRWLRPDQRRLLNAIHDHMVTANRHADQQAQQRAEHLATQDVDPAPDAAAAEQAQQHAEDQALRRAADDDATPAASAIDPDTSVTYDELPHPTR